MFTGRAAGLLHRKLVPLAEAFSAFEARLVEPQDFQPRAAVAVLAAEA